MDAVTSGSIMEVTVSEPSRDSLAASGTRGRSLKRRSTADARRRSRSLVPRACPRCGSLMKRVHRRWYERLISYLRRTARFRCTNPICASEGATFGKFNPRTFGGLAWILAIGLCWALGTCAAVVADRVAHPRGAETMPEADVEVYRQ